MTSILREKSVKDAPKHIKLTSLDDDCLEFLFGYLDLNDLLNVADTSRLFHTAVCLVFIKRKYHKSKVIINCTKSSPIQKCNSVFVWNPVTALKFLRNFGHLIWDLQLDRILLHLEFIMEIAHYLAKYCSKSLYSLSLCGNSSKFPFESSDCVFTNVDKLTVGFCKFGHDTMLKKVFPNLCILNLDANWYENPQAFYRNLPPVRDLTIQANKFEENEIKEMVKMNPQLERLEIYPIYSLQLIGWINECLPKLRCLELRGLPQEFYAETHEPIQLDHIVNLSLHVDNTPIRNIPFSFKQLKNLLVVGSNEPLRLNQKCLDFFGGIQHLKLLTILGWNDDEWNIQKFFALKNILSNVQELKFNWIDHITSDCILEFLEHSQCLRKMTIYVKKTPNKTIDIISKRLSCEWKMRNGLFSREYIIERNDGKQ